MSSSTPCKVTTFYSYKGGTGRTMALANVAWILASLGKRVLTVDWDLEAPGLHRYFAPFLSDPNCRETEGLVDWVYEYLVALTEPDPSATPDWADAYAELGGFAAATSWQFPGNGCLHFVSAGKQDTGYAERVNKLDWFRFYTEHGGRTFIESALRQARDDYDHILIDSRTGVADTSGICTIQLPDQLVALYTLNNQSIDGCTEVAKHALAQRVAEGRALQVLPVATRVELAEDDRLKRRQALARARSEQFVAERDRTAYFAEVQLPYVPYYAYEEVLTTVRERPDGGHPLLKGFLALASRVAGQEIKNLPEISDAKRQAALESYAATAGVAQQAFSAASAARSAAVAEAKPAPSLARWDIFISYPFEAEPQAKALHRLLSASANAFLASSSVPAGANVDEVVQAALEDASLHVLLVSKRPLLTGGWYEKELAASHARAERTRAPRIVPVLVDGAKLEGSHAALARYQTVPLPTGGERVAAQAILAAFGVNTKDDATSVRDRAVAAETRLEELGARSHRVQTWLVLAIAATVLLAVGGVLQYRQSVSAEEAFAVRVTALNAVKERAEKAQNDANEKLKDQQKQQYTDEADKLARSARELSTYATLVADQVAKKPTGTDFAQVVPQLDDASARVVSLSESADTLLADMNQLMLDQPLIQRVEAVQGELKAVTARLAGIASAIADKAAQAKDPQSEASRLWQEGYALASSDPKAAEKKYRDALSLNKNYAPAINSLGVLQLNAKSYYAALKLFEEAIVANPSYIASYSNRSLALLNLGDKPGARAAVELALQKQPSYAPALRVLDKLNQQDVPQKKK